MSYVLNSHTTPSARVQLTFTDYTEVDVFAEAARTGVATKAPVRASVVAETLPPLELVVEEVGGVDDRSFGLAVELLVFDAMGALYHAVEAGCEEFDVDGRIPRSRRCQWNPDWNSDPVSVWIDWTSKGSSREVVGELNGALLIEALEDAKDPQLVQSSIAVNW